MSRKLVLQEVSARRYWREPEARVMVEGWQRSGEELSRFARRYGIEARRLARWAARLQRAKTGGAVQFHPVKLMEAIGRVDGAGTIEIDLPEGGRVRVGRSFAAEDLRRVLDVLGERREH